MSKEAFMSTSKMVKSLGGWGSAPNRAGGAYSAPQTSKLVERGWLPIPKNPVPVVGPSGLDTSWALATLFTPPKFKS